MVEIDRKVDIINEEPNCAVQGTLFKPLAEGDASFATKVGAWVTTMVDGNFDKQVHNSRLWVVLWVRPRLPLVR